MKQLTISMRLCLLIGTMGLLLIVIGGIGLVGLYKGDDALNTVYAARTVPAVELAEIQDLQLHSMLAISVAQLDATDEQTAKSKARIDANTARANELWARYRSTPMDDDVAKMADAYWDMQKRFQQEAVAPALAALAANDLFTANNLMREKARPMFEAMREKSSALLGLLVLGTKQEYENSHSRNATILTVSIASIVLGLAFALVLGLNLIKGITGPLGRAVDIANAVAQGKLNQTIPTAGTDEIGELLRALSSMQKGLVQVVSSVRRSSESVASSCAEIARGNHDLSTRTEHQASTLEETAASMEELSDAVTRNAESARTANQMAQMASSVAAHGGEVVSEVVQTMQGINESSNKIADIISVIDGIAFQTNILALNAAVEAARAGEQGRGFAVVASEVRSLAGRSAEAAKEIKTLINTSVARVAQGSALVDKAGVTMTELVTSIQKVTELMGEISAANSAQSHGVGQIGEAVNQMDQVTQQNAALVEQMAAAASELSSQAEDLVHAVAVFTLGAESGASQRLAIHYS